MRAASAPRARDLGALEQQHGVRRDHRDQLVMVDRKLLRSVIELALRAPASPTAGFGDLYN
jgi:hypothetical protein